MTATETPTPAIDISNEDDANEFLFGAGLTPSDSLNASLIESLRPDGLDGGSESKPFTVDGLKTADWALRKLAGARAKIAEHNEFAIDQADKILAWKTDVNEPLERFASYLEGLLRDYHEQRLDEDGAETWDKNKSKTIKLPSGKLTARKKPDAWAIDNEQFLEWARTNAPRARRHIPEKFEPDRTTIKQWATKPTDESDPETGKTIYVAVTADGELVPGVVVIEGDIGFEAKTTGATT